MTSFSFKAFALGAALGLVLAVAPSCGGGATVCDPSNCAAGCCANGICLAGTAVNACGKSGLACNVCSAGQSCTSGSCGSTFTGGGQGGGGGTGGGGGNNCSPSNCASGCCKNNMCFPGTAADTCGTAGAVCAACTAGQECNHNACAAVTVVDSGVVDAGTMPVDAGTDPVDAGTDPVDAGTDPVDAGTDPVDAGTDPVDAGTDPVDAGMPVVDVVISQVFGGGGNAGAPYNADFVELHNRGNAPVELTNWSIQYGSSTSVNDWSGNFGLAGTLPAHGFVVARMSATGSNGIDLPAGYLLPLDGGLIAMSSSNGKVALVSSQTVINGACPARADVVDFIGFGSANCALDAGTAALSNSTAAIRKETTGANVSCVKTGSNLADFSVIAPLPHAATETSVCP